MRTLADDWPKALRGILVGAIFFLSILPSFGWAWHRVLPEHQHVFFGAPADDGSDDLISAPDTSVSDPVLCGACAGTQIHSGLVHLPGFLGAQILGIAVSVAALFWIRRSPEISTRVISTQLLYHSPVLSPLDPPPTGY